jgi:predicted transcriptional regulator
MPPKSRLPRPTDGELTILRVLWQRGPSTVRAVQEALGPETGYTTVLKFMQIMTDKRLLTRDESQRTHVYAAAMPEQTTKRQLVRDLLDRAFGGSAKQLVMHALSAKAASPADLAEIRQLIESMERRKP